MKKYALSALITLVLVMTPVLALAQGDAEPKEFTSEDGQLTFSYPDDWFVNQVTTPAQPFPTVMLAQSEDMLTQAVEGGEPEAGAPLIVVLLIPTQLFELSGMPLADDLEPVEVAQQMAFFFTGTLPPVGEDVDEETLPYGDSEEVELSDDVTAGYVEIVDTTTYGMLVYRVQEDLIAVVLSTVYNEDVTHEINTVAQDVAGTLAYTGTAEELMAQMMGMPAPGDETEDSSSMDDASDDAGEADDSDMTEDEDEPGDIDEVDGSDDMEDTEVEDMATEEASS